MKIHQKMKKKDGLTNIDDSQKIAPTPDHWTSPQTYDNLESVSTFKIDHKFQRQIHTTFLAHYNIF